MSPAKKKATTRKTARKKTVAKKRSAKKTTAKKTTKKRAKKTAAKKKTTKKRAKKTAAKKKTTKKSPIKAAANKKTATKAPKKPAAKASPPGSKNAKKTANTKASGAGTASGRAPTRRKSRAKAAQVPAADILPRRAPIAAIEGPSKLGRKWDCYECGAKFYDLQKDEPLCPKCGASQHDAPRVSKSASKDSAPARAKRRGKARMSPLLDEEDDANYVQTQDLDLGISNVSDDEGFVDQPDAVVEEDDDDDET